MRAIRQGATLVTVMIALLGMGYRAAAQVATTQIKDTVFRADGTKATGTVVVSWRTFTTAAGQAVAAGNTSAVIGPDGTLSVALAPNANATPVGSYYTAVLHLDDGTTSQQYWVVPVSATPVTLASIENQVVPTSVAMQTASRAYVDAKVAAVTNTTTTGTTGSYVPTTGGTMTGPLVLPADPVTPYQAADKHYVDTNVTALTAGMAQKVSIIPPGTQTVTQPAGTQLGVNALNGELYASQFQTADGGNGIANALSSSNCGSGCTVVVDPSYTSKEKFAMAQMQDNQHILDLRNGSRQDTYLNPVDPESGLSTGESINQISTNSDANAQAAGSGVGTTRLAFSVTNSALAGGSNQLPGGIENPPYGKANYSVSLQTGNYYTEGQHVQDQHVINCFAVGDCLEGSWVLTSSGGYRDQADEGAHPFDLQVLEDWRVFQGNCATGCTPGSTSLVVNATSGGSTQGEGRFLIDKNPSKTITTGQIVGGAYNVQFLVQFTGTNFPLSVFLQTQAPAYSQAKVLAPGTVTIPITTSNVPAGFSTSTSALPATSGVACIADTNDQRFQNFETANYTVVDASHIQLTLNKVHALYATVAVGGMCGYGIEQTVDTVGAVRQLFPVIGSPSPTSLYYAGANTGVLGYGGGASTSGYRNVTMQVQSIARQGNVVTATFTQNMPADVNGLTMTVSGVADASYNGSYKVTTTAPNQLTYTATGADGTSSGGTVSLLTGNFVLYPMAEVLSVYDPATKQVDGLMTLAANTVNWQPGDAVEEPHYFQQLTAADTEFITQYVPRPIQYSSAGKQYLGEVGPGTRGWQIQNAVSPSNYIGAGGTRELPDDAYVAAGPWKTDLEVDAGTDAIIRAHCNVNGCNRYDSGYSLFSLDSWRGQDFLYYAPQSNTAQWLLGGQSFTFQPSGFTANNVSATTFTGASNKFNVDGSGNVKAATVNLSGGASGSNYDLNIVDNTQNQLYIGTTDNSGYAVFRFGTPTQIWQFGNGGHSSALPDTWYVYDQTHMGTAFSIQSGTERATFSGTVSAPSYMGPSTAPSGACSTNGAWVFSQDGHATFCAAGTWVTKI